MTELSDREELAAHQDTHNRPTAPFGTYHKDFRPNLTSSPTEETALGPGTNYVFKFG